MCTTCRWRSHSLNYGFIHPLLKHCSYHDSVCLWSSTRWCRMSDRLRLFESNGSDMRSHNEVADVISILIVNLDHNRIFFCPWMQQWVTHNKQLHCFQVHRCREKIKMNSLSLTKWRGGQNRLYILWRELERSYEVSVTMKQNPTIISCFTTTHIASILLFLQSVTALLNE